VSTVTHSAPTYSPVATVWEQSVAAGSQAALSLATTHLVRYSTQFQVSGSSFDRYMIEISIRDIRQELGEIEHLFGITNTEETAS